MIQSIHNGRPTDPSVRALIESLGTKRGETITRDAIAEVVGARVGEHRYRSVVNAWKHRLLVEHGIHAQAKAGVGYELCESHRQVTEGVRANRSAVRRIRRAQLIVAQAPDADLTAQQQAAKVQVLARQAAMLDVATRESSGAARMLEHFQKPK